MPAPLELLNTLSRGGNVLENPHLTVRGKILRFTALEIPVHEARVSSNPVMRDEQNAAGGPFQETARCPYIGSRAPAIVPWG